MPTKINNKNEIVMIIQDKITKIGGQRTTSYLLL